MCVVTSDNKLVKTGGPCRQHALVGTCNCKRSLKQHSAEVPRWGRPDVIRHRNHLLGLDACMFAKLKHQSEHSRGEQLLKTRSRRPSA